MTSHDELQLEIVRLDGRCNALSNQIAVLRKDLAALKRERDGTVILPDVEYDPAALRRYAVETAYAQQKAVEAEKRRRECASRASSKT